MADPPTLEKNLDGAADLADAAQEATEKVKANEDRRPRPVDPDQARTRGADLQRKAELARAAAASIDA